MEGPGFAGRKAIGIIRIGVIPGAGTRATQTGVIDTISTGRIITTSKLEVLGLAIATGLGFGGKGAENGEDDGHRNECPFNFYHKIGFM
ncbi:hypothetical protein A3860_36895 [Niastella vici]|uniref:Uncharacterized protein n=1 Tax=Niastella vici TaxID=1703345 RepID=A0A1V9FMR7_9BACT|nr:hypothetical protein A3860_36895 [Niastella vici]